MKRLGCEVAMPVKPVRLACKVAAPRPAPIPKPMPVPVRLGCSVAPPRIRPVPPVIAQTAKDARHPHTLQLQTNPYGSGTPGYNCDACGIHGVGQCWHCGLCEYDLCQGCLQPADESKGKGKEPISCAPGDKGKSKGAAAEGQCFISLPSLVAAAVVQLKFQQQIFFRHEFASPPYLLRCRDMYLRFLDLKAKLDKQESKAVMVPTPGIDVWWQAHLIRPAMYAAFCQARYGRIVDRDLVASDPAKSAAETAKLWDAEYHEVYVDPTPTLEDIMPKDEAKDEGKAAAELVAKLKLSDKEHSIKDLVELSAVVEDRQWLPNLRTYAKLDDAGLLGDKFLAKALEQYKKFLYLCHEHSDLASNCVPPYPIDLFWHTHQMHPVIYERDCKKIAGGLINHTPWPETSEQNEAVKHAMGQAIWQSVFHEPIW